MFRVLLVLACLLPASASAQLPSFYVPPSPSSELGVLGEDELAVDAAGRAADLGDRRESGRILTEAARAHADSTVLHLARVAYGARIDVRLALRLTPEARSEAVAELEDIGTEHLAGVLLGIPAAISGVLSLVFLVGGFISAVECGTFLFIPLCAAGTPDPTVMTISAVLGGTALSLTATALGVLADAGSRRGGWTRRLESGWPSVAFSVSSEGATLVAGGRF